MHGTLLTTNHQPSHDHPWCAQSILERAYAGETYYDLSSSYYKDPIWLGTFLG